MEDKVAVVTGASGYLGSQVCEDLAKRKTNLVLVDKDEPGVNNLANRLESEYGISVVPASVDLLDREAFLTVRDLVTERFNVVDFIVNNAAFYDDCPGWGVKFEEEGYEAWVNVMKVNLLAPFFVCQALLELVQKSDCASIVNVSSMYGVVAPDPSLYEGTEMSNPAAYAASKGGLIQLTKWLSTMMPGKVRVNSVSPGGIERGHSEDFLEKYAGKVPLGRMTNEGEVSQSILFLLSEQSSYINGQNLMVDGGWSVW